MKKIISLYLAIALTVTFVYANVLVKNDFGINLVDYFIYSLPYTDEESSIIKNYPKIIYGADQSSPPLRYYDEETSQYKGVVIDYLSLLSVQLGTEIVFHPYQWDTAIDKLKNNETDLADMFPSPEREKDLAFSIPIYKLKGGIIYKDLKNHPEKIIDLKGKTITYALGDYAEDFLNENENLVDAKLVPSDNVLDGLAKVQSGEVDLLIGDEPVITHYLESSEKLTLHKSNWYPYENNVVLATSNNNKTFLNVVNKAVLRMQKNQEVEKIRSKWMGMDSLIKTKSGLKSPGFQMFIIIELLGVFMIAFLIVNRLLEKEIISKSEKFAQVNKDLEHIFESIPEMKMILNDDYRVLNINIFFVDFLNTTKKEIIGNNIWSINKLYFLNYIKNNLETAFDTGNTFEQEIKAENRIYFISCYPMLQDWPTNKKLIVTIKDVTLQKNNEEKILQMNKMAAVGQLANGIAHEVKNPLGIIRSYTYLLKDDISQSSVQQKSAYEYLVKIENSTEQANSIINNLLNFSKLAIDDKSKFNLYQLILEVITLERKRTEIHQIETQIICDKNLCVHLEKESLKHILINLISNGVESMVNSDSGGKLTVVCKRKSNSLLLSVEDSGTGIKKEDLAIIFEPFFTTKISQGGTGIGLYIVYNQVQRLGGNIIIESKESVGTKFLIEIDEVYQDNG